MFPDTFMDPRVRSEVTRGVIKLCEALAFFASKARDVTAEEALEHADALATATSVLEMAKSS